MARAILTTSFGSSGNSPSEPGTQGTCAAFMAFLAETLSPIRRMVSALGPIKTDSSASLTYLASRSASEWTTTVLIPSSRQARWIRRAISPRLAIRIFSNMMARSADHEQRLAEFDGIAVLEQDGLDHAGSIGFDFV